ncbi:cell division inhibitor SepF [Oceanobacillus limi]|uniref:Cell division protein SepF n=1 Tax=Oceanobacillus limi TaxID=930131 RepID=A0A1I0DFW7_9BACI|nr:cell division protein SepF [Oceanobacillus limi]SET30669.1 cell division inhibitor SepF [Oceanobacillus limi]
MSIRNKIKNFFTMDEEYEYEYVEEETLQSDQPRSVKRDNVISLTSIEKSESKVVLCEPRNYDEVQEIADNIVNRRAVVINLQRAEHYEAMRIVDFLSGTVYALNGNIQKLGSQTFLCAPNNVDISGSISDSIAEQDFSKGW